MKKLEEKSWGQIIHKPLSQRTGGKVRVEGGRGKPKFDHNPSLEENSTATVAAKKDTSKGIVRLGRTETRKIEGIKTRLMIKIPQPL